MSEQIEELLVSSEAAGKRLDSWLADALPGHSRSEVQRWIKEGRVFVDGSIAKAGTKLNAGQSVHFTAAPETLPDELLPENIPLHIVYEDADMAVINKPSGLVVHPAPGHPNGTLVNGLLYHFAQNSIRETDGLGAGRPGIVHRLDRETSGLIAVAKHNQAYRSLQAQFKARTVYKEYLALVEGRMDPPAARISAPIGRHPTDRKRQAILLPDPQTGLSKGREAITEYHTEATYSTPVRGSNATAHFTLLKVNILTGRTHQIRVHLAWYKRPVVGDTLYGHRKQRLPLGRQFLHAHRLHLRQPMTNEEREFVVPLPDDLQDLLGRLTASFI